MADEEGDIARFLLKAITVALWTRMCLNQQRPSNCSEIKKHDFQAQFALNLDMLQIVVTAISSGI